MKRLIVLPLLFLWVLSSVAQTPIKDGIKVGRTFPKTIVANELKTLGGIDTTQTIKEQLDAKIDTVNALLVNSIYELLPGAVRVVLNDNTQHALTGSTSLTTLYTDTIPANSLGLNGQLEIKTLWSCNNSAGTKTLFVRINGVSVQNSSLTTSASAQFLTFLQNRNSLTSQVGYSGGVSSQFGNTTVAIVTQTLNTSQDMIVTVTGQLQTGTDNMALESIIIKATK